MGSTTPHDTVAGALRRRAPIGLLFLLGLSLPPPADAADLPPIVFPVAGPNSYRDTFGAPRDGGARTHKGTDILAARMVPVIAILDGVVTVVSSGAKAGTWIELRHDGGWTSRYLHLNNDSPGTDDGRGHGVAAGIAVGARVAAGRVIGYVGDSGNAETTTPHLHFEIRAPGGAAINPYPALRGAVPAEALEDPGAGLSLLAVGRDEVPDDDPVSTRHRWARPTLLADNTDDIASIVRQNGV
jgi:murein DD-endopeptidase MepM/ murein hydrolase activator NlpD